MRPLIVQELVTIDGFAAGPDGELDFVESVADFHEVDEANLEILTEVDAIVLGADTYRMFVQYWPTSAADGELVADAVNSIPKLVCSSTLGDAPWGDHAPCEVVAGDAAAALAERKHRDGGAMIVWGSLSLADSLLRAGLVDEMQLRVCPVVLGTGRKITSTGVDGRDVELAGATPFSPGIVALRYRIR